MSLFNSLASTNIETFEQDKKLSYGIFSNGLWRRIKTPLGHFTHKVQDLPASMGLTKECEFQFDKDFEIPKVPYSIYKEILEYYRHIYKTIKSEVYTCVVWDKTKQDFFIHIPVQKVSGAQVDFENESSIMSDPNYVPYLDLHSHNVMNAFFSAGDVKDEVSGRFFGVIGHVTKEQEASVFKVAYDRQFVSLDLFDVFDSTVEKLHPHSNYSLDYSIVDKNIVENVYTYPKLNLPKRKNPFKSINDYVLPSARKHKNRTLDLYPYEDANEEDMYGSLYTLDDERKDYSAADYSSRTYMQDFEDYLEEPEDSILELIALLPSSDIFEYDFERVFSNSKLQKDVINLYDSLTKLVLESGVELDETLVTSIVDTIKTNHSDNEL